MVSLQEADWEYIMKEAPAEPEEAPAPPPPEVESVDHVQIDKLIVSRAFSKGRPHKKRHWHRALTGNEILMASVGGVVALLLLSLLIYLIQMM
jgi:hypothetical protein